MTSRIVVGATVGRLTLVSRERTGGHSGKTYWTCRCSCGGSARVRQDHLRTGRVTSCGCWHDESARERGLRHGMTDSPEHRTWRGVIDRCRNPKNPAYANYGGRGIDICDRWRESFEAFLADVGARPSPKHSIDRIDNARGYEPGNVRWATRTEQNRNTRRNRFVRVGDRDVTVAEAAEITGVDAQTIYARLRKGWDSARACDRPPRRTRFAEGL